MKPLVPAVLVGSTLAALLLATVPAGATWSIVIADANTREVAVGTVTCLNNFDLLAIVPVVVVGKGGGACQAAGDFDGTRRPIIFAGLQNGASPQDILVQLAAIPGHQSRQYGIADTQGRMITFTGVSTNQWAGGVIGMQGTMVYAVQGNILAGGCVVPAIEAALLDPQHVDMPAKLMAGMQAARVMGGDGRCSCSPSQPTSCGCPPPSFTKSGHIGCMVVARIGDTDDSVCNAQGCADGNYFMKHNVPFQPTTAPDPVIQLQQLYDAWRAALIGRPDAVHSLVSFDPPVGVANGGATTTMHVTLLDWQDTAITATITAISVTHAPGSAQVSAIGPIVDTGGGTYAVTLTAGIVPGVDRFQVRVNDGIRPVTLMPNPPLTYYAPGDLNCDGLVTSNDVAAFVLALVDSAAYASAFPDCHVQTGDFTADDAVDGGDVPFFVSALLTP